MPRPPREVPDCTGYAGHNEVNESSESPGSSPKCNFIRAGESFNCSGNYREVTVEVAIAMSLRLLMPCVCCQDWGLRSGHFLVSSALEASSGIAPRWMRTAALPSFRKVWGKVDSKLPAGTRLRVYVEHHFPVKEFYGQKAGDGVWAAPPLLEAFVMSTASVVGGRSIRRQQFLAVLNSFEWHSIGSKWL